VTTNFNLVTINNDATTANSAGAMAIPVKEAPKEGSSDKSYLLKSNNLNNNNFCNINGVTTSNNHHQRHMSVPVGGNTTPVKTLPTSSSTFQASITQKMPNNSPLKAPSTSTSNASPPTTMTNVKILPSNQQLYENIKIKSLNNINNNHNSNSNNVSYENINLEYINRLMKEGYSKESVISALCISRNNFEMACDILHEFVSTNQQANKVADVNR
jgi:hypothetical protein